MKPRKPLRKQSKRRTRENREHVKLRKVFLDTHTICFKCGCFVARKQRTLHHFYGRVQELLNFVPGFRMADWECHDWIEKHRKESIELGFRANERLFNRPSLVIPT